MVIHTLSGIRSRSFQSGTGIGFHAGAGALSPQGHYIREIASATCRQHDRAQSRAFFAGNTERPGAQLHIDCWSLPSGRFGTTSARKVNMKYTRVLKLAEKHHSTQSLVSWASAGDTNGNNRPPDENTDGILSPRRVIEEERTSIPWVGPLAATPLQSIVQNIFQQI